ncbi:MAG TPA: glycosyltransferase family 87 protein [Vicinamibacterales bacterium]|nr:glycosyltransferase family 87 protein [Vicinamibacterales bacterium]
MTGIDTSSRVRTRPTFVDVYLDPILYVLAAFTLVMAFRNIATPLTDQHPDFVIFWDNLQWYAGGHDLYTAPPHWEEQGPNLAAPALLFLLAPLLPLPLELARAVWMAISIGLFALCSWWVARTFNVPTGRVFSLLVLSRATHLALIGGTFAAPLAAWMTRAWLDHRQGRDATAGVWIGIAIACKLLLLPCVGYAVLRRRWRMVSGIVCGMAATVAVGVAVGGIENTALWIRTLRGLERGTIDYPINASLMAWLARTPAEWTTVQAWWLCGSLLIGMGLLWRWLHRDDDAAWSATISGSLLASPLGWVYYTPLLVGPFVGARSALLWAGYALCALPLELVVPRAVVASTLLKLTVGSAYFFGVLLLFVGSVIPKHDAIRHGEARR